MDLSIIIVNWNTRDMLRDCLASSLAGLGTLNAEVIVVDNASSDGSQVMIEQEFPKVLLIVNDDNRGFAAANNQALKIAGGRYVLLLNSDTVVHGDVLQRTVEYLDAHSDVGVMGCRVLNTDGTMQPTCSQFPTLVNLVLLSSGLWKLSWIAFFDRFQMLRWDRRNERDVDVVSGCYMAVRATAIGQVGLLDESFFFFGEETDWCRRMKVAGWRLCLAPVGEITHLGGGSVRKLNYKRDLMLSNALVRLHRKHGGIIPAAIAWMIVFGFNLSRAVFWTVASLVTRRQAARERRNHFVELMRNFGRVWPSSRPLAF